MTQAPTKAPEYAVNCAGCKERRVFTDVASLAAWTQQHKCWQERDDG